MIMNWSLISPGVCAASTGVRGSICASVFIVGAGAPGGVRLPWANAVDSWELKAAKRVSTRTATRWFFIIPLAVSLPFNTGVTTIGGSRPWDLKK